MRRFTACKGDFSGPLSDSLERSSFEWHFFVLVVVYHPMPITRKTAFSRRLPDLVTEELAALLSSRSSYEFKDIFEKVFEKLKARNAASGGEEMLRLRSYEKLQHLVSIGMVKRVGKKFKGVPKLLATLETTPPPPPAPQLTA